MKFKTALVIHGIRGNKVIVIPRTSGIRKSLLKIQASLGAPTFPPKRGVQTNIAFVVMSFHTPFSSNASTLLCAAYAFCVSNLRGYILTGVDKVKRVGVVRRVHVVLLCYCLDSALREGHRIARERDAIDCNYSKVF